MRRIIAFTLILILSFTYFQAQERIDDQLRLSSQSTRSYSVYLPSSYDGDRSLPLMVSFHPYGTSRWNAASWRDMLISFAEKNQVILLCPDGGEDGRTDDPEDLSMSMSILQQFVSQYQVNRNQIYTMGYSWGARACLKFTLARPQWFRGMILMGMASDNPDVEFESYLYRSKNMPVYLIHGKWDSPALRFQPLHESLLSEGSCVGFSLVDNLGHSIDFQDRDKYLNRAFSWLEKLSCHALAIDEVSLEKRNHDLRLYPNPGAEGGKIWIRGEGETEIEQLRIYQHNGILIKIIHHYQPNKPIESLQPGTYHFLIRMRDRTMIRRTLIVR